MSDASTLCRACALCCDGTLFDRVPLRAGEGVPLPLVTRPPTQEGAPPARHLAQPCAGLVDRSCSCYRERPAACRGFSCLLLIALEADEVGLPAALQVVEGARAAAPDRRAAYLRFHFGRLAPPGPSV